MDKITSFTIDHLKLLPGVYVSRKDRVGDQVITTFDIRMTPEASARIAPLVSRMAHGEGLSGHAAAADARK